MILLIQCSHKRSDGYLSDFCDAAAFEESSFIQSHPNAIQIILYYDDVEICPLGSKSKAHKLGKSKFKP